MSKGKIKFEDTFIRIEKVAEKLGISIEITKKLILEGKLQAIKLEGIILISQMSLDKFITKAEQQAVSDIRKEIHEENQNGVGIKSEEIVLILKEFVPKNCNVTLEIIQNIVYEQGMLSGLIKERDIQMESGTSNVRYKHLLNSVLQRLRKPNNQYGLKVTRVRRGLYEFN